MTLLKKITVILVILCAKHKTVSAEIYAIVVGISQYDITSQNLHYADDDARAFHSYLIGAFPASKNNFLLLTDKQATRFNIQSLMKMLFAKAKPSDEVIFFFSGHGASGKFVCYDSPLAGNYLLYDSVKAIFKSCQARLKLCFADACFSGGIKTSKNLYKNSDSTVFKVAQDLEIIVFMSSQPWQVSQEKSILGNGVFTYFVMEGLKGKADNNGNNLITAKEFYQYVRKNVMNLTLNKQTPIMFGKFNPDEVIFTVR